MSTSEIAELLTADEYRAPRERIFPSTGSLQWFIRKQRSRLVDTGALLLIAGRWHIRADRFDECVIESGAQAAKAKQ